MTSVSASFSRFCSGRARNLGITDATQRRQSSSGSKVRISVRVSSALSLSMLPHSNLKINAKPVEAGAARSERFQRTLQTSTRQCQTRPWADPRRAVGPRLAARPAFSNARGRGHEHDQAAAPVFHLRPMAVLRWYIQTQLITPEQEDSDLLFPSVKGGYRSPSVLNKPFADACEAMRLGRHFSQRGLRRTFNDLARAAEVESVVTRII